ncbi:hypothetical protein ABFT51_13485 [Paenibacillus peoriae]|uniref:hypothetical protein n=1 Tax=Paenibacillus peoriae TaxID=59893 RepID=UPI0032AF8918
MRLFCVKNWSFPTGEAFRIISLPDAHHFESVNVNSCGKPLSFKRRDVRGLDWITGEWFQKIRFLSGHRAEAHSVVMRSATKTIRFVHSIHSTTNVSGTFAVGVFTSFLRVKSPKL